MPKSLLPPTYIQVPVRIAFDKTLSPGMRDTAVQLLAFAWGDNETQPMTIEQIAEHTGKASSTIYEHMRILRDQNVLRWRTAGDSTVIVSFMASDYALPEKPINISPYQNEDSTVNNNIFAPSDFPEFPETHNATMTSRLKKGKRKDDTCPKEWMDALYDLCNQDKTLASAGMRKRISDAGKVLIRSEAKLDDLADFRKNWYARDWRGKQGQPPTPEDVRNCWRGLVGKTSVPSASDNSLSPSQASKMFDPRV